MDRGHLARLADALSATDFAGRSDLSADGLLPMPVAGVAHDHMAIVGTGRIVRLPRLSQTGRSSSDNLTYQAACFSRAAPSGVTPRLHGLLPPCNGEPSDERQQAWPMGALVVDAIDGRPPHLPDDLPAVAHCLAAIHTLAYPADRAPLPVHDDPIATTLAAIDQQADWLDRAQIDPISVAIIREEIACAKQAAATLSRTLTSPILALVVSDAHPGNFLIDPAGKAWFVDLEKAAYGQPAIDVAHATLPTSVGWDARITGQVTDADVTAFEVAYLAAVPESIRIAVAPWLAPMRRLTWLRTITWFARWRARSNQPDDPWSAADLPPALRAHMAAHVTASLAPQMLDGMREGLPQW